MSRIIILFAPLGLVALLLFIAANPADASILPAPLTLLNNGFDVITPATTPQLAINHGPSNPTLGEVIGWVGVAVTELYKSNVDDGEESVSFLNSYETTYDNEPDDPEDALLEYVSGLTFASANLFALLKDGNQDPSVYIFNISNWDRTSDLSFEDFWPDQGAISHLSIYGAPGGTTGNPPVPEPLSFLIWAVLCISCVFGAKRVR